MENNEHFKLYFFYFNKEDKRFFVPKRIRWLGWTLNFAHPVSYLFLIGLLLLIFGIRLITK